MRMLLASVLALAAACGPKADPRAPSFDEDLGPAQKAAPAPAPVVEAPRPEAPLGKGLRSGTITRAKLLAVLDSGPGTFLRQLEVTPRMDGARFVGWQLVQLLDRTGPLADVDLMPGDVLLAINGKPLARPDQLQALWDSLRTANSLDAQLWRGDGQLKLSFEISSQ
jgi:S1-C subfamily serine protease